MFTHILVATDGSALAARGLEKGVALAKALSARLTIVHVTELWSISEMASSAEMGNLHPVDDYEAKAGAIATKILDAARKGAEAAGVKCETLHVADARPAAGIVSAATRNGCDLIVMATHGRRGVSRLVLGSQAAEVMAHAKIPVLICP